MDFEVSWWRSDSHGRATVRPIMPSALLALRTGPNLVCNYDIWTTFVKEKSAHAHYGPSKIETSTWSKGTTTLGRWENGRTYVNLTALRRYQWLNPTDKTHHMLRAYEEDSKRILGSAMAVPSLARSPVGSSSSRFKPMLDLLMGAAIYMHVRNAPLFLPDNLGDDGRQSEADHSKESSWIVKRKVWKDYYSTTWNFSFFRLYDGWLDEWINGGTTANTTTQYYAHDVLQGASQSRSSTSTTAKIHEKDPPN